jgi:hypothetical protein
MTAKGRIPVSIGFGSTERADAIVSIAAYPRYVSLFFLQRAFPIPLASSMGRAK